MRITILNRLVAKLNSAGAECVVKEHGNETLVQTGRFGYWFNEKDVKSNCPAAHSEQSAPLDRLSGFGRIGERFPAQFS
jgi:hypothetical protein